jgi:hypothetical protein
MCMAIDRISAILLSFCFFCSGDNDASCGLAEFGSIGADGSKEDSGRRLGAVLDSASPSGKGVSTEFEARPPGNGVGRGDGDCSCDQPVTAKESSITIGRSAFISPEVRYHPNVHHRPIRRNPGRSQAEAKREELRGKREEGRARSSVGYFSIAASRLPVRIIQSSSILPPSDVILPLRAWRLLSS